MQWYVLAFSRTARVERLRESRIGTLIVSRRLKQRTSSFVYMTWVQWIVHYGLLSKTHFTGLEISIFLSWLSIASIGSSLLFLHACNGLPFVGGVGGARNCAGQVGIVNKSGLVSRLCHCVSIKAIRNELLRFVCPHLTNHVLDCGRFLFMVPQFKHSLVSVLLGFESGSIICFFGVLGIYWGAQVVQPLQSDDLNLVVACVSV